MKTKREELERCSHSLAGYEKNQFGITVKVYSPCILVFHTAEDSKKRPIHQTASGKTWS